ncbi:MAG: S41 family peptidase [Anaerolineales bacterium]|nr:S41 family peptidase [Anaerolineales bacterium]
MSSRTIKLILGTVSATIIACSLFAAGIAVGTVIPAATNTGTVLDRVLEESLPSAIDNETTASDRTELLQPFWEAWDIIHDQYVDQPVDDQKMIEGAIEGMLWSLGDEHTSYMTQDEYQQANMELDGSYEGIGAYVDTSGEYLTIINPMPGSPAEEAGLKPKDIVIAIDGEDMTGIDPSVVIQSVLGPAGTKVILTILREGEEEPFDVGITRKEIIIPSVEYEMLDNNIAYLRLYDFGTNTTRDMKAALKALLKEDPVGLILDLRGNTGGYLSTSIQVASEFINEGIIVTERFGDETQQAYQADRGGLATEIPLVVLVNGGSASASEIVAGAIQDYERGLLIGETTYGKGSVQNWIPLSDDNGAVRVTIARWYTPNDRQIHQAGLEPDILVELTEEDFENELDPQLDRAVQELLDQVQAQ